MKKINKWIEKGRKNCKEGSHWLILHYADYQLCPLCGHKEKYDKGVLPEYNGFIVCSPKLQAVV